MGPKKEERAYTKVDFGADDHFPFSEYKVETRIAAYLGFKDLGEFKRFRFSFPVLQSYEDWEILCGKMTSMNSVRVFHDHSADQYEQLFPETLSEIEHSYPLVDEDTKEAKDQNQSKKVFRLAAVLRRLAEAVDCAAGLSASQLEEDQEQATAAFRDRQKRPDLPAVTTSAIVWPKLGPRQEFAELPAERYLRALMLLRSLNHVLSASKWKDLFANRADPYRSEKIADQYVPAFMRESIQGQQSAPVLEDDAAKEFFITVIRKPLSIAGKQLAQHETEYLSPRDLSLPTDTRVTHNPCKFRQGAEFRDVLRRQLDCAELLVDLQKLDFTIKATSNGPVQNGVLYNHASMHTVMNWSEFIALVKEDASKRVEFQCTLRPLQVPEDGEALEAYPYEYTGLPSAVLEDLYIDQDNDIAEVPIERMIEASQSQTDSPVTAKAKSTVQDVGQSSTAAPDERIGDHIADQTAGETLLEQGAGNAVSNEQRQPRPETEDDYRGVAERRTGTDPWNDPEAVANHERRLKLLRKVMDRADEVYEPHTPQTLFPRPDQREKMLKYYSGFDAWESKGLRAWQEWAINGITQAVGPAQAQFAGFKLPQAVRKDLERASRDIDVENLSLDIEAAEDTHRHLEVQQAFTGGDSQTGPPVDLCLEILDMIPDGKHPPINELTRYRCNLLPNAKVTYLASQVTGAAFMLQRTYGEIPVADSLDIDPAMAGISRDLDSIRTGGGVIADTMGLGKTHLVLLYLSLRDFFAEKYGPVHSKSKYRPTLLLLPSGVVLNQWTETIQNQFPHLTFLTSYDSKSPPSQRPGTWISSRAMRAAPKKVRGWPKEYRYVFDQKDPRAEKVIIISTDETFAQRSLERTTFTNDNGLEKVVYKSRWPGVFSQVIIDEAHGFRNPSTRRHLAVRQLKAAIHWFITATPVVNTPKDYLSLLSLLWPMAKAMIETDKRANKWVAENVDSSLESFDTLAVLARQQPMHRARLEVLNIRRLGALIQKDDLSLINRHFHLIDDLVALRRSAGSNLRNSDGSLLPLRSTIPPHDMVTVRLKHTEQEAPAYQAWHRNYARSYVDAVSAFARHSKGDEAEKKRLIPYITRALRALTTVTTSTLLPRFDRLAKTINRSVLMKDISVFRSKGLTFFDFINMTRDGFDDLRTGLQKLQFFTTGGPKLKQLLQELYTYGCVPVEGEPRQSKLLVCEEIPASAWMVELLCEGLHVKCAVIHSDVTEKDRLRLVQRFNNPDDDLRVLVLMYGVFMQGVNLDKACWRVLIMTAAHNAPTEAQTSCRVVRVSQQQRVTIVRIMVANSHDLWRETKQSEKSLADLAMKANSPAVKAFLVQLLQEANETVRKIHAEPRAQEFLQGRSYVPLDETVPRFWEGKAESTEIAEMVDTAASTRPQRVRKAPLRYSVEFGGDRSDDSDEAEISDDGEVVVSDESEKASDQSDDEPDIMDHAEAEYHDSDHDVEEGEGGEYDEDSDTHMEKLTAITTNDPGSWPGVPPDQITFDQAKLKDMRRKFLQLSWYQQESMSQNDLQFYQLLSLDPERVYIQDDLKDPAVLYRAFRLLFQSRLGQTAEMIRLTPHIDYHALPECIESRAKKASQSPIGAGSDPQADGRKGVAARSSSVEADMVMDEVSEEESSEESEEDESEESEEDISMEDVDTA